MFAPAENQVFGFMSFLSMALLLLPSPWHWRVRNTGTLMMIGWGAVGFLNVGINAFAFNNNLELKSLVACDVSAAIDRVWQIGFTAATLCVLRRLEQIASTRQVHWTEKDVRNRLIFDLCIGIGIPVLQVPLFFVVQDHRLNVIENLGCIAPLYHSVPAIFVFYLWRFGLCVACLVYAAVLQSSNSGLTVSKYNRLMGMALVEILVMFSFQMYFLIKIVTTNELLPYPNWNAVHQDFGVVAYYPATLFDHSQLVYFDTGRWFTIIPGFIFFLFFGLSQDARMQYKQWCLATYRLVCRPFQQAAKPQSPPRISECHVQTIDVEKAWNLGYDETYGDGILVHSSASDATGFQLASKTDDAVQSKDTRGVFVSVTKVAV